MSIVRNIKKNHQSFIKLTIDFVLGVFEGHKLISGKLWKNLLPFVFLFLLPKLHFIKSGRWAINNKLTLSQQYSSFNINNLQFYIKIIWLVVNEDGFKYTFQLLYLKLHTSCLLLCSYTHIHLCLSSSSCCCIIHR